MNETPKLGQILDGSERRDAVHVAIAPVTADAAVFPGEHVGIKYDKERGYLVATYLHPHIGVIDPFLKKEVLSGQKCYLFVYPNTVTSLRHVWFHESFKVPVPV